MSPPDITATDGGDAGQTVIPQTPATQKLKTQLDFNPGSLARIGRPVAARDLVSQTSEFQKLNCLKEVVQIVREHYFHEGILPMGEDHTNPKVMDFTTALAIYLQHFGATTEGGLRNLDPDVLHTTDVADTSPVSHFNSKVNIHVLLGLVQNIRTLYKKFRRHVMLTTDTALLGEI